jgi:hypothetical protein
MAKSLKADKLADIEKRRKEIEEALASNDTRKAYGKVRKWCKEKPAHVPKPTLQDEEKTRSDFEKLYTAEESPGDPIPVRETPFGISDLPPTEKEICRALRKMKTGKAAGASGMKVGHLKSWMESANAKEEQCDPAKSEAWKKVLEIIELVFQGKEPPKVFAFGILTLIPKADPTQMRGIALLEVIYKLIAAIINNRMADAIVFHKAIHGFRIGRSTMTATMILKLLMQHAQRTTKPTYYVFLDLKKAYDTMDRKRTLEILKAYGVGPIILGIIEKTWENDTVVPKQDKYYAEPFSASRGVRQGDILSPMIFNVVMDAVIRESEFQFCEGDASILELVEELFYADDGALAGEDPLEIQRLLDIYTTNFARMGLKMNAEKTEAIIMKGGELKLEVSKEGYEKMINGGGESYRDRIKKKVKCDLCGKEVNCQNLKRHQGAKTCEIGREKYRKSLGTVQTAQETPTTTAPPHTSPTQSIQPPAVYCLSMDNVTKTCCAVDGCPYKQKMRASMRLHFRNKHNKDTIIIQEEGQLPKCDKCGIFTNTRMDRHQLSKMCQEGAKFLEVRKIYKENKKTAEETVFTVQGVPIKTVTDFKYLGRVVNKEDSDWSAVNYNLKKAIKAWHQISRILTKRGSKNNKWRTTIYKSIVEAVLLFGAETWVLSKAMETKLQSFHHRCARAIAGRYITKNPDDTWTCPPTDEILKEAGLCTIQESIRKRQVAAKPYARNLPIYKKCEASNPLASCQKRAVLWQMS